MSAILKICQNMYTNDILLPMLKRFEVKNTYIIFDLFTIPWECTAKNCFALPWKFKSYFDLLNEPKVMWT